MFVKKTKHRMIKNTIIGALQIVWSKNREIRHLTY